MAEQIGHPKACPVLDCAGRFWSSRFMAPWKPAAALLMLVALVATSTPSHGHGPDTQPAGHTDCTACHIRQLSVVQVDTVPAPSAPDLVAHDVPSAHPQGELGAVVERQSTRGPPA